MAKCQYFNEVWHNRPDGLHVKYLCGCTGQPCLVDDPCTGPGACMRHEWYQKATARVVAPAPAPAEGAAVQGILL